MDSEYKLAIYPEDPDCKVTKSNITSTLNKLLFLGEALSPTRYTIGDEFLSLLTFMGCSPNIELEPQYDHPYCYIEINSHKHPLFISGKNTKFPPCPHCKSKLTALTCSSCNALINPEKLNWRKTAFTASCWIIIGNIYELEAIPNDYLLDTLKSETKVKWKYAYIRQTADVN